MAGACAVALGALLYHEMLALWVIYTLLAVSAFCRALQWVTFTATMTQMVPAEQMGRTSAMIYVGEAGQQLVAPALAALALGAVGFLSMGMKISWTKSVATMFTVYMTLSNVGHVVGNKMAAWLGVDLGLSYEMSFGVAGIATIAPLVLLAVVNPATVDAKRAEQPQPDKDVL